MGRGARGRLFRLASKAVEDHHRNSPDSESANPYFISTRDLVQEEERSLNSMKMDLLAATIDKLLEGHTEQLMARLSDLLTNLFMSVAPASGEQFYGYQPFYPYYPPGGPVEYMQQGSMPPQPPPPHPSGMFVEAGTDNIDLELPLKKKRRKRPAKINPNPAHAVVSSTSGEKRQDQELLSPSSPPPIDAPVETGEMSEGDPRSMPTLFETDIE